MTPSASLDAFTIAILRAKALGIPPADLQQKPITFGLAAGWILISRDLPGLPPVWDILPGQFDASIALDHILSFDPGSPDHKCHSDRG